MRALLLGLILIVPTLVFADRFREEPVRDRPLEEPAVIQQPAYPGYNQGYDPYSNPDLYEYNPQVEHKIMQQSESGENVEHLENVEEMEHEPLIN